MRFMGVAQVVIFYTVSSERIASRHSLRIIVSGSADRIVLCRLLLMFDRWRKLLKAFYNEKKHVFDISKVPDIYDSAKYDAIHNAHLGLQLEELYDVSFLRPISYL